MPDKDQPKKFRPLYHEDLEYKQFILAIARDLMKKEGFENGIAAATLYASFAEYLAENLLQNLRYFAYQATYNQYTGIIYIDETAPSRKGRPLGQVISELQCYSFPDKPGVLSCFDAIAKARNNMFHEAGKTNMEGFNAIVTKDVFLVREKTEELVTKIDTIYAGLNKIVPASGAPVAQVPIPEVLPLPTQQADGHSPKSGVEAETPN